MIEITIRTDADGEAVCTKNISTRGVIEINSVIAELDFIRKDLLMLLEKQRTTVSHD